MHCLQFIFWMTTPVQLHLWTVKLRPVHWLQFVDDTQFSSVSEQWTRLYRCVRHQQLSAYSPPSRNKGIWQLRHHPETWRLTHNAAFSPSTIASSVLCCVGATVTACICGPFYSLWMVHNSNLLTQVEVQIPCLFIDYFLLPLDGAQLKLVDTSGGAESMSLFS